jgi:hypothetical protein
MVHWNTGVRTLNALQRIKAWDYPLDRLDIVVWDEGSFDGSAEATRRGIDQLALEGMRVTYRRSEAHPGVTRAFNLGLALTDPSSDYVLRLDNDVELETDVITQLVNFLESHEEAGAVAPRVMYHDDRTRLNGGPYWVRPITGTVMGDGEGAIDCDATLCMTFLVRRKAIAAVGRWFDPDLFLFHEEPEFCWQMQKNGYRTYWLSHAVGYHEAGSGTGQTPLLSQYLHFRNDTIVMNRITPLWASLIRNPIRLVRLTARCLRDRTTVPLRGFFDGLRKVPLTEGWWNTNLRGTGFVPPRTIKG